MLQMFIPNQVGVYGSRYFEAKDPDSDEIDVDRYGCYQLEMEISKTGLRALDQPRERCDMSTKEPNTSQCIARYIENQLGCSISIHGGRKGADMSPCSQSSELDELFNITRRLADASANTVFEITGCLASCNRYEYGKIDGRLKAMDAWNANCYGRPGVMQLNVKVMERSYREEEQYVIYDVNSFIGGVGGILGLCNLAAMVLLGCGAMSIHNKLAKILGRLKQSSYVKGIAKV